MSQCDDCLYFVYDEDYESYYCEADMDQDDYARLLERDFKGCPFYYSNDEYKVVRHQM